MSRLTKKEIKRLEQLESDDTKYCIDCKQIKLLYEFGINAGGRKLAKPYCLKCARNRQLQQLYGISGEDYEKLFKKQGGQCAICGTIKAGEKNIFFSIDHNHQTNKIRGLLCYKCNTALGMFNDDPGLLEKAAQYLRDHSSNE